MKYINCVYNINYKLKPHSYELILK
ncbi:hypothetical protein [Escherichia coli]|nr:hypothetical protein [Escherichia coli]NEY18308.1 hypothetical protein [Escherichia coli]